MYLKRTGYISEIALSRKDQKCQWRGCSAQNSPVRNVRGTKNKITKPITIRTIASPFPPAMKILLAIYRWLWDVGGNINYYRSRRRIGACFSIQKNGSGHPSGRRSCSGCRQVEGCRFQGYAEEYRDKSASSSSALSDSYALPGASARPQKPHFFIPIQQI